MFGRTTACAALCALLFAFLAVPAPRVIAYEPHVLRYSDGQDISSLNPFFASSGNIVALNELTGAEFIHFDARGNPIPELVTAIPTKANGGISADGRTITWHLRRGVRWSDGAPFDSSDVTYTVSMAKNEQNNLLVHDPWDRLIAAAAPDKYTVVFHLREPNAAFISDYFSTQTGAAILPRHILGPGTTINEAPYNALPVGIGPFRYAAYHRGENVIMEANPYYWRGRPKLDKIVYEIITDQNTQLAQLQTGELDLWDLINGRLAESARRLPGKNSATRLSNFISGIYFNVKHSQVADPIVRRALRLATNRQVVFDKIVLRNGTLTESVVPQITRDYLALPLTAFDPAQAARLLEGSGWRIGSDGIRHKHGVSLALDLGIPAAYAPSATLAAILQSDWRNVGVDVTIHTWAASQFFAPYSSGGILQTGRFDAALLSLPVGPVFANINGAYDCASSPPRGGNIARYCNPRVDALNERYLHSYDARVQNEAAAGFQRIIDEDVPAIVLYERAFLAVFDNRLSGYHPHSFSLWGDPLQLDI